MDVKREMHHPITPIKSGIKLSIFIAMSSYYGCFEPTIHSCGEHVGAAHKRVPIAPTFPVGTDDSVLL